MMTDAPKPEWKRTMLNQMLFVWVYVFNIFIIFYFWNERLFPFFDFKSVVPKMALPSSWGEILFVIPIVWSAFAIGLTPFLVGAVWCRHNHFYFKMTRNSLLVKIMWGIFLAQSALIAIDVFFPPSGNCARYINCIIFVGLIPILLWGLFCVLHSRATIHVARRRKESHEEWCSRIGVEMIKEIAYAQMPVVSSSISIFVLLILATI